MKQNYNPTLKDIWDELQRIKKVLGIILDKEGIRKSDLDNFKREKEEADRKAREMMARTQKLINRR